MMPHSPSGHVDKPAAPEDPVRTNTTVQAAIRRQLLYARNPECPKAKRLQRLAAPHEVTMGDSRHAIQWILRALRVERGLALRGAAQYSFTRHVALLRALEIAYACGTATHSSARDTGLLSKSKRLRILVNEKGRP